MTKTQIDILSSLLSFGWVHVVEGSRKDKAAHDMMLVLPLRCEETPHGVRYSITKQAASIIGANIK